MIAATTPTACRTLVLFYAERKCLEEVAAALSIVKAGVAFPARATV